MKVSKYESKNLDGTLCTTTNLHLNTPNLFERSYRTASHKEEIEHFDPDAYQDRDSKDLTFSALSNICKLIIIYLPIRMLNSVWAALQPPVSISECSEELTESSTAWLRKESENGSSHQHSMNPASITLSSKFNESAVGEEFRFKESFSDKNLETKKPHSKKKPEGYVKRPLNAFFLFRKHIHDNELVSKNVEVSDQRAVSRIIARMWKNLPPEWQEEWHNESYKQKLEFERLHPEYKFQPNPHSNKGKPKRNLKEEERTKEECENIADAIFHTCSGVRSSEDICDQLSLGKTNSKIGQVNKKAKHKQCSRQKGKRNALEHEAAIKSKVRRRNSKRSKSTAKKIQPDELQKQSEGDQKMANKEQGDINNVKKDTNLSRSFTRFQRRSSSVPITEVDFINQVPFQTVQDFSSLSYFPMQQWSQRLEQDVAVSAKEMTKNYSAHHSSKDDLDSTNIGSRFNALSAQGFSPSNNSYSSAVSPRDSLVFYKGIHERCHSTGNRNPVKHTFRPSINTSPRVSISEHSNFFKSFTLKDHSCDFTLVSPLKEGFWEFRRSQTLDYLDNKHWPPNPEMQSYFINPFRLSWYNTTPETQSMSCDTSRHANMPSQEDNCYGLSTESSQVLQTGSASFDNKRDSIEYTSSSFLASAFQSDNFPSYSECSSYRNAPSRTSYSHIPSFNYELNTQANNLYNHDDTSTDLHNRPKTHDGWIR